MKVLIIGYGSIAKKHIPFLKKHCSEIILYRTKGKNNSYNFKKIYDIKEIDLIKPNICFITNPTNNHMEYSLYCANKKIDLFIEKP
ncbi:MAG: Gfo/Idh/MocA family oxidoreductase, partial [bacterium]